MLQGQIEMPALILPSCHATQRPHLAAEGCPYSAADKAGGKSMPLLGPKHQ